MIGKTVLDNVATLLTDSGGMVWPRAEILGWLNEFLTVMVKKRPDLFGRHDTHSCSAGAEQSVGFPRCAAVLEVVRVVGGRAVLLGDKPSLDAFNPNWINAKAGAAVNWFPHEADPKKFWVYPPAATTQELVVRHVAAPAPITDENAALPLSDDWQGAATDYVCFRAFEKQVELAGSANVAAGYLASFNANFPAPASQPSP
jgi:hypothetical protein